MVPISGPPCMLEFHSQIHYTYWLVYFPRTLHKILWHVTSSRLLGNSLVLSHALSFPLFTMLQALQSQLTPCLATTNPRWRHMPEYLQAMFYKEVIYSSGIMNVWTKVFYHVYLYLWINPRTYTLLYWRSEFCNQFILFALFINRSTNISLGLPGVYFPFLFLYEIII